MPQSLKCTTPARRWRWPLSFLLMVMQFCMFLKLKHLPDVETQPWKAWNWSSASNCNHMCWCTPAYQGWLPRSLKVGWHKAPQPLFPSPYSLKRTPQVKETCGSLFSRKPLTVRQTWVQLIFTQQLQTVYPSWKGHKILAKHHFFMPPLKPIVYFILQHFVNSTTTCVWWLLCYSAVLVMWSKARNWR